MSLSNLNAIQQKFNFLPHNLQHSILFFQMNFCHVVLEKGPPCGNLFEVLILFESSSISTYPIFS